MKLKVRIVTENVPLLVPSESFSRLGEVLDFSDSPLKPRSGLQAQLAKTPSWPFNVAGSSTDSQSPFQAESVRGKSTRLR